MEDLKKARRHVVLEVHEAPQDSAQLSMMVHDEISMYYHTVNPAWSGDRCLKAASKAVAGEIVKYKNQRDDYIKMDSRWADPRPYFVNVINIYRKLRELNETDDHIVGYNGAKTRWSL